MTTKKTMTTTRPTSSARGCTRHNTANRRRPSSNRPSPPPTSTAQHSQPSSRLPAGVSALPSIPQGRTVNPSSAEYSSPAQQQEGGAYTAPPGWENIQMQTSHRHPTRLSDIIEEQTARTSPSRTSYLSGHGLPGDGMPPSTMAGGGSGSGASGNMSGTSTSRR